METAVDVESLTKYYRTSFSFKRLFKEKNVAQKNLAVDDLSFDVKKGELFGLLGPNGAGKTPMSSMSEGVVSKSTGMFLNYDIGDLMYPVRKKDTYLRQSPRKGLIWSKSTDTYRILNQTGLEISRLSDGKTSLNQISEIMAERHGDSPSRVFPIIRDFLLTLERGGFVELKESKSRECGEFIGHIDYFTPIKASFELTLACDLRCRHCYAEAGPLAANEMDTDEVINILKKLHSDAVKSLTLTGGSPFLRKDFFEILDFCKDKFRVEIISNGYRIDKNICKKLASYDNINLIQLSIDGADAQTHDSFRGKKGSFDRVVKAARELTLNGVNVGIASMCMPLNSYQMEDMVKLAISVGAKSIGFGRIFEGGRAKGKEFNFDHDSYKKIVNKIDILVNKYKTDIQVESWNSEKTEAVVASCVNCGAGYATIFIASNGDVRPCASFLHPAFKMGNLRGDSLKKIMTSPVTKFFEKVKVPQKSICEECKDYDFCYACPSDGYRGALRNKDCKWFKQEFPNFPGNLDVMSKGVEKTWDTY
ncbi:MAG: hypothetical protein CVT48_02565 [Thermoplasmata archaeon HGW-Thermoplasmata-1]|nr:MAG: hypothetical protein CVT48_02565 [Thermoplasmata archaeon HGW-Thermoplasmata-1]